MRTPIEQLVGRIPDELDTPEGRNRTRARLRYYQKRDQILAGLQRKRDRVAQLREMMRQAQKKRWTSRGQDIASCASPKIVTR
jgi:hypothetical protein